MGKGRLLLALDVSADIPAAIIINPATGRVLFERNAHESKYPASTTKIATLGFILNKLKPNLKEKVYVSQGAVRVIADAEKAKGGYRVYPSYLQEARGTSAGLPADIQVSIEDLLYGAMLPSGNDACNVLAEHFGSVALGNKLQPNGNQNANDKTTVAIQTFIDELNLYVQSIGCKNTFFTNPHGLFHPDHATTAFDLVLLARDALKHPLFRTIVSCSGYETDVYVKGKRLVYRQQNKLLKPGPLYCEYATGVKTGHLARAKHCLVASCKNNNRELIGVFLKCPDRRMMFMEMKRLMDQLMQEEPVQKAVLKPGPLSLQLHVDEIDKSIGCYCDQEYLVSYYPSEEPKVKACVVWENVVPPIERGQIVGTLRLIEGEEEIASIPLRATESVACSLTMKIKRSFQQGYIQELLVVAALILVGLLIMRKLFRRGG